MDVPKGLASAAIHAITECAHCGVLSQYHKIVASAGGKKQSIVGGKRYYSSSTHYILRCLNCSEDTYMLHLSPFTSDAHTIFPGSIEEVAHSHPVATPTVHESVPQKIKDAAIEAEKCFGVGAYNACGVMTRRAMHSLCEDKGATGTDLFKQLQYLKENYTITPDLWQWSEELRILGRNGAHPEWPEVTAEDAQYGVNFLREIIRFVYINPHELSRRRLKETSKKI